MDKIKEMGEGIVVEDPPVHRATRDQSTAKGKRSGNEAHVTVLTVKFIRGSSDGNEI